MEKIYVEPQVEAKNAPSGSYVAGCPVNERGSGEWDGYGRRHSCVDCERTQ